jgi:hypothetical protein
MEYKSNQTARAHRVIASKLGDEMKQEMVIHRGTKALLAQAAFGSIALEQIQGNGAHHSHILSTFAVADAGTVFAKGDIHDPMKAVFNRPMMLCRLQQSRSMSRKTGNVEDSFQRGLLACAPLTLDADDAGEVSPAVEVADMFKRQRVTDRPAAANLNASAGFVDSLVEVHLHSGKLALVTIGKPVLNILFKLALVTRWIASLPALRL